MHSKRHELWDELDAFDPKWQKHYATTAQAANAAGGYVFDMWVEYCRHHRQELACNPRQVPDAAGVVRREQEASASSSLPYRLDTIGTVRQGEE